MTLQEFRKEKTDIELSEEKLISERDGLINKLNIQHNIEAKIDLFKETCHKFLSKINDPKIVTNRVKKDIIKLIIDEVVIDGEKLKIAATIPLPNKVHEREIAKADTPDTFNSGATLGPINQTKMERIWNKHKQINTTLKPKVFVAMSGGVDSSVAAALLKKQGCDVRGIHIKMWSDPSIPCQFKEDRYDAMRVAAHLGIPFETWDFTEEYKTAVVEYMVREYADGRTPNPDVMCNRDIKFGVFLKRALECGADFVATGHYALLREVKSQTSHVKSYVLAQARDLNKDQSYFLWTLGQEQLRHCLFPLGEYTKPDVREMARTFQLPTSEKKDSQGICFMGEMDMREFLKKYIPVERGRIVTTRGAEVGEHEGLQFYTIGQRHGLGANGGGIPYYVAEKRFETNTLVVSEGPYDKKLFSQNAIMADARWVCGRAPRLPLRCHVRIRYRQPLQNAVIVRYEAKSANDKKQRNKRTIPNSKFMIQFREPQRAVTPGQSVVLYCGEEVLGGGIITLDK